MNSRRWCERLESDINLLEFQKQSISEFIPFFESEFIKNTKIITDQVMKDLPTNNNSTKSEILRLVQEKVQENSDRSSKYIVSSIAKQLGVEKLNSVEIE